MPTITGIDILNPTREPELAKLAPQQNGGKQTKACLFTLIIYSSQEQSSEYLQELAEAIVDKFPCRIIFIQSLLKGTKNHLHIDASSVISGNNEAQVICDKISIEASHDQLSRVPFIVLPQIVSDLPVFLLWGQNPFEENVIFPHLKPYATRVLIDSGCSENLHAFCLDMIKTLKEVKMDVMDVNWALLSSWRDLIAQLFNNKEKLNQLRASKFINIIYNDKKEDMQHPAFRAIYLQGWLASRLKWEFKSCEQVDENQIFSYTSLEHPIIITLSPKSIPENPTGAINDIDIVTHCGHSYQISRNEQLSQAVVRASSADKCDMPFTLPLPNIHRGLNFVKEIFFQQLSDHYRDMLDMIAKISNIN